MIPDFPPPSKSGPYRRSPLVMAAYFMVGAAVLMLLLHAGMYWILSTAGMGVLLALGEILVQLRRR
jgi:hypothetical protein